MPRTRKDRRGRTLTPEQRKQLRQRAKALKKKRTRRKATKKEIIQISIVVVVIVAIIFVAFQLADK
jgi:uncharacterized membrane protein YvbJ